VGGRGGNGGVGGTGAHGADVLEHVAPPYEQALANLCQLLKPGGVLILTVPMKSEGSTDEHFPELYQYDLSLDMSDGIPGA
jgi:SAM-dependent methyltransferase